MPQQGPGGAPLALQVPLVPLVPQALLAPLVPLVPLVPQALLALLAPLVPLVPQALLAPLLVLLVPLVQQALLAPLLVLVLVAVVQQRVHRIQHAGEPGDALLPQPAPVLVLLAVLLVLLLLVLLGLLQALVVPLHLTPQARSASLPRRRLDVLESRCSVPARSGRRASQRSEHQRQPIGRRISVGRLQTQLGESRRRLRPPPPAPPSTRQRGSVQRTHLVLLSVRRTDSVLTRLHRHSVRETMLTGSAEPTSGVSVSRMSRRRRDGALTLARPVSARLVLRRPASMAPPTLSLASLHPRRHLLQISLLAAGTPSTSSLCSSALTAHASCSLTCHGSSLAPTHMLMSTSPSSSRLP